MTGSSVATTGRPRAALADNLAVACARRLGFEPHEGFEQAAAVLGEPTGPSPIGFGRDGNPFGIDGPYDDAAAVLATLRRSVGENNFHFLVQMPDQPRRRLMHAGYRMRRDQQVDL